MNDIKSNQEKLRGNLVLEHQEEIGEKNKEIGYLEDHVSDL